MNVIGFSYVNMVTLRNERGNHFHDQHRNNKSFILTVFVVSPVLYLLSMIVTLRDRYDVYSINK